MMMMMVGGVKIEGEDEVRMKIRIRSEADENKRRTV